MEADLHVHTKASDGTLSPAQCIKMAISLGLKAISITDHDTTEGLEEAIAEAAKYPDFTFVPGIEVSSDYFGVEVHILGYYIDRKNKTLRDFSQEIRLEREERCKKIVKNLNSMGINIVYEDLRGDTGNTTVGRPHIAQLIVKSGYEANIRDAFDKYLTKGRPAYVPRKKIDYVQAIEIVKQAGGLPVLAHPIFLGDEKNILHVLGSGFIGIEIEHPNQSQEFKTWLNLKVQEMNLIATGGSDFHGDLKENKLGEHTIEFSAVKKLQKLRGGKI